VEPYKIRINANFNEQQMDHLKLRKLSDPKSTTRSINENNLSNLRPCTKYNITAEIKNPDNVTQKFMHSEIISTSYASKLFLRPELMRFELTFIFALQRQAPPGSKSTPTATEST
jgi:hypothetical protein